MTQITSASNSKYKYLKTLSTKKARKKNREYTVEGIKSVRDAINSDKSISVIAVSEAFYNNEKFDYPENISLYKISDNIFGGICDTTTPQGIIAVIKMEETENFVPNTQKAYVYCDHVSDPGNLGTIIRTADAAGFGGIILSRDCADLYSPKTVRSSMGSFFNIKIICDKTAEDLEEYKKMGFCLYGGALNENTIDYKKADMTKPTIIIVGNEANGITEPVLRLCQGVKIPIIGGAESLNAAVAAAILMYELVSQRT